MRLELHLKQNRHANDHFVEGPEALWAGRHDEVQSMPTFALDAEAVSFHAILIHRGKGGAPSRNAPSLRSTPLRGKSRSALSTKLYKS